jgi:hypothetical protein
MRVEFSRQILKKKNQKSNFMKIRPVGADLVHSGGRTDRHGEANSCFSQFCESTQKKPRIFRPHGVFICCKQFSKYTTITSLHKFNQLGVFFKRNHSVFCAVRTESL